MARDAVKLFEPLATKRLTLRYLASRDLGAHLAMRGDPLTRRYQSFPRGYGSLDALAFFAWMRTRDPTKGGWFNLCIAETAGDRHAGDVAVNVTKRTAMIGVTLERRVQGQGYATEALQALLGWLEERGIRSVKAEIDARNERSIKLFTKRLKFKPTGSYMDGAVEVLTYTR